MLLKLLKTSMDSQIKKIHCSSLEILERTGVRFMNEEAVKLFQKAGCRISEGNIVHLPAWRVEWALGLSPKQIIIYDF